MSLQPLLLTKFLASWGGRGRVGGVVFKRSSTIFTEQSDSEFGAEGDKSITDTILQKIQYEKTIIFLVLTYCTYFIPVWSLEIFMYLENPQILLAFIIFKTNIDSQSLKQ